MEERREAKVCLRRRQHSRASALLPGKFRGQRGLGSLLTPAEETSAWLGSLVFCQPGGAREWPRNKAVPHTWRIESSLGISLL